MYQPRSLPGFPVVAMAIHDSGMWPTLKPNSLAWVAFMRADYVYQRGQIVIFQAPLEDDGHRDASPTYWLKRILAIAGDTVAVDDEEVSVNEQRLQEPYVMHAQSVSLGPVRIPHGHVWVQGDNRPQLSDPQFLPSGMADPLHKAGAKPEVGARTVAREIAGG